MNETPYEKKRKRKWIVMDELYDTLAERAHTKKKLSQTRLSEARRQYYNDHLIFIESEIKRLNELLKSIEDMDVNDAMGEPYIEY